MTMAACAALLGMMLPETAGADQRVQKTTVAYRTVGGLKILADVYRPDDERVRPVVVWIHGGALIQGHREAVSDRVAAWARRKEYALVSIDYRLAPETKLPEIIADLEDAFRWLRGDGANQFHLDPERIAVTGGSAGGYLTLTAGFRVNPAPRVLLSLWGYGDLVGPWLSEPSPHERHQSEQSREDAFRLMDGPVVADSRERKGDGAAFYRYCRQHGVWPMQVAGKDPVREADSFFPYMAVKNVNGKYPPTVMIHGTADTDVPYEQSTRMAEEFRKQGVPHLLLTVPDAEHGLAGGDPIRIEAAYEAAFEFVERHLEK